MAQLDTASAQLVQQHLDAVKANPASGGAWGRLGGILRTYDFRADALRCLTEAARLEPNEARWPYLGGLILASQDPEKAGEQWRRAVAICGNEPPAPRLRLARLLAEGGNWNEASRELAELLRAKPDDPPALLTFAFAAQAQGQLTNALKLAERCTNSAYTARAAWTLLSSLHQRLGDTNSAQFAVRRAASVAPDLPPPDPFEGEFQNLRGDAHSLRNQAQQLQAAGKLQEAALLIKQLVEQQPQFAETWLILGRQLYLQRQPVAAEQAFRRYLEMEPQAAPGHFQLGMSLLAQNRFPDAAAAFENATRLNSELGPAFFNLGFARMKAGQSLEAVPAFREAIRLSPEYLDSYLLLADLFLQLGRKAEAVEMTGRAQALNPQDQRVADLRERIARH
jgi:tetratricopeptide (TPR) repeat protein